MKANELARRLLQEFWKDDASQTTLGLTSYLSRATREDLDSQGAAMAVARLLTQRGAAEAFKMASGHYPEGLEEVRA